MNTINNNQNNRLLEAQSRVKELRNFYQSLAVYIVMCSFLALVNWFTSPGYWWVLWVIFGWGLSFIFRSIRIFNLGIWGSKWEQRKIEQYLHENK